MIATDTVRPVHPVHPAVHAPPPQAPPAPEKEKEIKDIRKKHEDDDTDSSHDDDTSSSSSSEDDDFDDERVKKNKKSKKKRKHKPSARNEQFLDALAKANPLSSQDLSSHTSSSEGAKIELENLPSVAHPSLSDIFKKCEDFKLLNVMAKDIKSPYSGA